MTTTLRTILRDSALVLPLLLVLGWALGGLEGALGMALTGVVSLVNLLAMAWVASRGPTFAMVLLPPKLLLAIGLFALIGRLVDPVLVGLGLGLVMIALAVAGARAVGLSEAQSSFQVQES